MKIDTNNLSVMKGFISSYGWVKHKTTMPIDYESVPDHICEDFDDDCYDLPLTHWHCYETDWKFWEYVVQMYGRQTLLDC